MAYNGWTNWETWNLNLWLTNDESMYRAASMYARDGEDSLQEYAESIVYDGVPEAGIARDFLAASLHEVDWSEIRAGLVEDEDEDA